MLKKELKNYFVRLFEQSPEQNLSFGRMLTMYDENPIEIENLVKNENYRIARVAMILGTSYRRYFTITENDKSCGEVYVYDADTNIKIFDEVYELNCMFADSYYTANDYLEMLQEVN